MTNVVHCTKLEPTVIEISEAKRARRESEFDVKWDAPTGGLYLHVVQRRKTTSQRKPAENADRIF